jgi:hypothetical protein
MRAVLIAGLVVLGFHAANRPIVVHHTINLVGTGRVLETVAMRRRRTAKLVVLVSPAAHAIVSGS